MIGLPQMAPIPTARPMDMGMAPVVPPMPVAPVGAAPAQTGGGFGGVLGGLGRGIGNFIGSPTGGDFLTALGMSLMSSPRDAPLQNFGQYQLGLTDRRMEQQRYQQQQEEVARKRREEETARNQTATWLKSKFGLSDDEALAAAQNPTILQHYLKQAQGGSDTRFGLTPIYGTDAEGNTVLGVLGDDGSFKAIDTGGINISTGVETIKLGDRVVYRDKRSGAILGSEMVGGTPSADQRPTPDGRLEAIPGSTLDVERQQKTLTDLATLESDLMNAEQTVQQLDELEKHPGLSAIVGPLDQFRPSWSMDAQGRDALARYNQVKGRAFLQAYGMLKGGGAITEVEGLKAEQAMARMDRAQSEEEFKQALKDFREAVVAGTQKLRRHAAARAGQGAGTSTGVNWRIVE